MACLPLTDVNQSVQRGAPSRGVSLSIQVQVQTMMSKKSQIKKHIQKSSVMLCLHTLTTDQSESRFNVRYATQLLGKDIKRI
jgi:hypothetical protein